MILYHTVYTEHESGVLCLSVLMQDQYVFIHDALNDYLTCGDTSVPAHELRRTISTLAGRDGEGRSGFERQFEVGYAKTILFVHQAETI